MPSLVEDYLADLTYLVRGAGIPVRDYEVVGPECTPENPLGVYMLTPDNVRERTPEEMEELRLDAEATRAARFREVYAMIGLQVAVHPSGALDISLGADAGQLRPGTKGALCRGNESS